MTVNKRSIHVSKPLQGFIKISSTPIYFIYGYMESDIWSRTFLIVREETRCRHIGYSFQLTARVLLYAPSNRQDSTYHGLCYTSRGALAGTRNSSMGPPHEGSTGRPIAPWANALTTELLASTESFNPISISNMTVISKTTTILVRRRKKEGKIDRQTHRQRER